MHTKYTLRRIFTLVILLGPVIGICSDDPMASIDKTFTYKASYTGAKIPEIVEVKIAARNINSPVTWTLSIKASNREIFRHTQTDTNADALFHDDGPMENCHGYIECKKKYYFSTLPNSFTHKANLYPKALLKEYKKATIDEYLIETLNSLATEYLISHKVHKSQIPKIIESMIAKLRSGKVVSLVVQEWPVTEGTTMIWVPEVNLFVPCYHP